MFKLSEEEKERAERLHKEAIVVDSLAHALYSGNVCSDNMLKRAAEFPEDAPRRVVFNDLTRIETQEIVDGRLKKFKELWEASGVDAASVTMGANVDTLTDCALWTRRFDALDWLVKATSVKDIEQAKEEGKRSVILNFQDNYIGNDLDKIEFFYNLGVRIMGLALNVRNFIGDGFSERTDSGLSYFGLQVVKRMNELGILVDVSHSGHKTSMDAIEFSTKPVISSHATCSRLYEIERATSDELIKALGQSNGYCGIMLPPFFLTSKENRPSLHHFLDHLEHAIEIAGIDKVGIGTDHGTCPKPLVARFDKWMLAIGFKEEHNIDHGAVTEGWEDWDKWPNITCGLVSRGYSDKEIKGILGGNFLRVFKQVAG